MTIKLKPEHVGTRVLLSDGKVGLVSWYKAEASHFWIHGDDFCLPFSSDGGEDQAGSENLGWPYLRESNLRVTLLLDAPNPLDVPVPEWCRRVIGWRVFDAAPPHVISAIHGAADFPHDVFGWSPAPGQLPPREDV